MMKTMGKIFFSMLTVSLLFVACSKKSDDTPVNTGYPQPIYTNGVCVQYCNQVNNMPSLTGVLAQGAPNNQVGSIAANMQLNISVLGDQGQISQLQQMATNYGLQPFQLYSGPVALSGSLQILQTIYLQGYSMDPFASCQIPAGTYNLNLSQPGFTQNVPGTVKYSFPVVNATSTSGSASITLTNVEIVMSAVNNGVTKLNTGLWINNLNGSCAARRFLLQ